VLTDNGGEFRSNDFRAALGRLSARHTYIRAGRPQTNGHVEALHRLILEECWRPAFARYLHVRFTGLKRDLQQYTNYYNTDRTHHGRLTRGRIPADIVYGANKVKTRRAETVGTSR
jgi:transposase InsO family protein